jgi:hypothetical protein
VQFHDSSPGALFEHTSIQAARKKIPTASGGQRTTKQHNLSVLAQTERCLSSTYNTHGEPLYGHSATNGTTTNGTVLPYDFQAPVAPAVRRW